MTKEGDDKGPGPYRIGVGDEVGVDRDRISSSSCDIRVHRRPIHPSVLRRLYVREGRSIRNVALAQGVNATHVWRSLKAAGIPTRRPGRPIE